MEQLIKLGLTAEQAKIYLFLLSTPSATAKKISLATNINRSLVYKITYQLIEKELVREDKRPGLISRFVALHPSQLEKLVEQQKLSTLQAEHSLSEISGQLISQFNVSNNKPNVRFYEGLSGLQTLYKDILNTESDIVLLRSHLDDDTPERESMIRTQIRKQVQKNISTKVISTKEISKHPNLLKEDIENKVTRCQVPHTDFNVPAQMLVYGNKVSFTSFNDPLITTIVEDKNIAETCLTIFNNIWKKYY